jgi:hypothetical protein
VRLSGSWKIALAFLVVAIAAFVAGYYAMMRFIL